MLEHDHASHFGATRVVGRWLLAEVSVETERTDVAEATEAAEVSGETEVPDVSAALAIVGHGQLPGRTLRHKARQKVVLLTFVTEKLR